MARKRKTFIFTVTVTVPHDVSKAHAKRELRTRVNDLCEHHSLVEHNYGHRQAEESDVRVRKVD